MIIGLQRKLCITKMLYGMALGKLKNDYLKHEFIYIISSNNKRKSVWYSEYFWNTIEKSSYRYRCYTPPEGEK
jgi:hypothetical protein